MASLLRVLPGGSQTPRTNAPHEPFACYQGDGDAKILIRSISVLDEWLEKNAGHIDDELRVRRVKHWREQALEQLTLRLKLEGLAVAWHNRPQASRSRSPSPSATFSARSRFR